MCFADPHFCECRYLTGGQIWPAERKDSELFYLSSIAQAMGGQDDDARIREHPRWAELCESRSAKRAIALFASGLRNSC
jgi:hypothetical protein